ncbi:MAG TPA: hypothetical protein VJH63_03045 [Candidatus Paceibacterota bacterium]
MTKEEKFVVNPLEKYFQSRKLSGAYWEVKHKPRTGRSATGWDLQVEHKNRVLLIEAKYIRGPSAAAIAGLTVAPLVYRPEKMKNKNFYRSQYFCICWAIGCGYWGGKRDQKYKMNGIYQVLLDCFILNLNFWKQYTKLCRVEYIYFINKKKEVAKIRFNGIINLAIKYRIQLDRHLRNSGKVGAITEIHRRKVKIKAKRLMAENLMKNLKFKQN